MAAKKRLIDANEAYEAVIDLSGQADTKSAYAAFWKAGKEIQKLPTVDAVEVVRCKDCRFWEECDSSLIGKVMCCTGQGNIKIQKSEEDYCSYGERRC